MEVPDNAAVTSQDEASAQIEAFADSYTLFSETTRKLRETYRKLEERFERVNERLEEVNQELRQTLSEKDRVSNYLNNILESLSSGVLVVDLDGQITLFNKAAEQIVGYTEEEAIGCPYEKVIDIEGDAYLSPLYTLREDKPLIGREKIVRTRDGRTISLGFSTSLVIDKNAEILGAVEVFNDLTEVKRLEAEIRRVHTLAALGEMAATVAHEIRNPLGGIAGYAGLLERDLDKDDPRRRLVKKIIEGVARLNRIVTSLLTYTRPVKLNLHRLNVVQLVEEVIAFFEIDVERNYRNIDVQRSYDSERIDCKVDPEQFQQILLNLLYNGVQAMPDGGALGVEVHLEDAAHEPNEMGALRVGASLGQETSEALVLKIIDSGIGMSDEVLGKLFTPFFTTREEGTGLGLVTSRKIVEAHGGQLYVESKLGAGTTVMVSLPVRP